MIELLGLEFMQRALLAALFTGLAAPAVGTYLVQRRLALMGDGIGHVAVTGVAIGLLTGVAPIWTAVIVAVLGAILIELIRESGSTIVLVAHELGEMAPLVDRAIVMRDGRIAYDGAPLADHEVHHADFGEAHTHHHHPGQRTPTNDRGPQGLTPLDGGPR